MEIKPPLYYCGDDALQKLRVFCQSQSFERFTLVSDFNTHPVLGERVEKLLCSHNWTVHPIVLQGREIVADEATLDEVFCRSGSDPGIYLAAGSGTLTDITRYCSYKQGTGFISLPTAPSVDGFASSNTAIVIRGNKISVPCLPPLAIFADLLTLCQSPKDMIAAGFGDIIGKYTSLADWKLAHIIMGDSYNAAIANRIKKALQSCVDNHTGISCANPQGITGLMNGLVESGICMTLAENSRPASGAEHHLSHYWELMLLRQNRPAVLHGAKVGIGAVLIAKRWQQIRCLNIAEVEKRLANTHLPLPQKEQEAIKTAFPSNPAAIIQGQSGFISMTDEALTDLNDKLIQKWGEIIEIATAVPAPQQITALLKTVHAPVTLTEIGLDSQDEVNALRYAHYLRNQLTISKLGRFLGLWD